MFNENPTISLKVVPRTQRDVMLQACLPSYNERHATEVESVLNSRFY